ncbi:MAG: metallophosphoesterase family protein [Acidobacteriota bacterium]
MRVIVHLSDIHFGRVDPALIGPLSGVITRIAPDLVAVSGDLTQRARRSEFTAARRFLDGLPFPRLAVPGNHDVPLYNVVARLATPLDRYKRFITDDLSPVYRDEEVIVVGVNTARAFTWGETVRSFTLGEGRINEEQVDGIVGHLSGAPRDCIRIVVTHHPFDLPEGVREERLIGRAAMAMAKLSAAGADLFLAGHLHISHIGHTAERYQINGHSALIVQAGTVSTRSRGEQPSFNVLRIERPQISVERFVWDPATHMFAETAASIFRHTGAGWSSAQ